MGSLRAAIAFPLLLALSGLVSAIDYGVVSSLDFNLAPGESATQTQEVSRCREEGCTDTLRLAVTVPSDFSATVSPQEIKVEKAKVGQTFSANVTVTAKASASGRSEGILQVTSGSGDTWKYRLNLVVRSPSAAVPAPARTSGGGAPGAGTTGASAAAPAPGGPDMMLPAVGGGVVVAILILLLLQRRGLLPRGAPRPAPRGPGRGGAPPSAQPAGSPLSALLRPVGSVVGLVTSRVKGLASRASGPTGPRHAPLFARASREMDDAQLESEWERFVRERLPGEAEAAQPEELPPEEAPPPVAGDAPPRVEPEEGPSPPEPVAAVPPGAEARPETAMEGGAAPGAPAALSDEALLALRRDLDRVLSGMGALGDLKTMVERTLDDLRSLREEVDQMKSAPRAAAAPAMPVPGNVPPDALKRLQADLKQEMMAAIESQMAANTEKLGTWLREALKAATWMKAQTPQSGGPPGSTGLQPLFDGLWKEVGSLRNAIQRLDMETKKALREMAHPRAPEENLVKEMAALKLAVEKQQAEMSELAKAVQELRSDRAKESPGAGVALSADLDALRTILRDIQRQMEGVEARLKNQELTFARGEEVRSLFRDLSSLREDLAEVRMAVEEGRMEVAPAAAAPRGEIVERRVRAPDAEAIRKEIEKQEAFLNSLEEYRKSGLMPERLYLEKKEQSEERVRELRRKLRL